MRAQVVTAADVAFLARGSHDHRGNAAQARPFAFPREKREPIANGHLEIEEDQFRQRELLPIRIFLDAEQVIDRALAVSNSMELQKPARARYGTLHEERVIIAILNKKNGVAPGHGRKFFHGLKIWQVTASK
jgi:hypothetical protein